MRFCWMKVRKIKMVNFTSELSLSEKDKQRKAQQAAIDRLGNAFYSLPLPAREEERRREYEILFNGKDNIKTSKEAFSISLPALAEVSLPKEDEKPIPVEAFAPEPSPLSVEPLILPSPSDIAVPPSQKHETFALSIELNEKQRILPEFVLGGKCCVFTGAAGTGKTTAVREVARQLYESDKLGYHNFKLKGTGQRVNAPSVAFVAFTNRAAANMARAILKDESLLELSPCITTIHNLLEYEPEYYDIVDEKTGESRTTMRFVPRRTAANPLTITHLFIEESSQVGALDLYPKLMDALRPGTVVTFIGDINQLQPIFSPSILNYALVGLPVIELTEVYRQALDSPIIKNAHLCLKGLPLEEVRPHFRVLRGNNLKKIPSESSCADLMVNSFRKWIDMDDPDTGEKMYDPEQDIVLSPFNKHAAGTIELNYKIAQFLGQRRDAMVWEVLAGIRKLYLAEGDKVMFMKQDGVITKISHNALYIGKVPMPASTSLTRFGTRNVQAKGTGHEEDFELTGYENLSIDTSEPEDEERKRQSSHNVEITLESGQKLVLSTTGELSENNFSLGYALTVHKAQGCEWRKVFIMLHRNHAVLLTRELLYTAITRAREYCTVIDLCNVTDKAIATQRVKGNTIEEKIQWFNSEVSLREPVSLVP